MADSQQFPAVSLSLNRAYEDLEAALQEGIKESKKEMSSSYTNAEEIYKAIRKFLGNWLDDSKRKAELTQRASFVESQCGPDSSFKEAAKPALFWAETVFSQKFRSKWDPEKRWFRKLQQANREYVALGRQVDAISVVLDEAIGSGVFHEKFQEKQLSAFENWRFECNKVLMEAGRLEADGCRCLLDVYQHCTAENEHQRRDGQSASAFVQSGNFLGVPELKELSGAALALMEWASADEAGEPAGGEGTAKNEGQSQIEEAAGGEASEDSETTEVPVGHEKTEYGWYISEPDPESKFKHGPLEGSLKDLALWSKRNKKTLRKHNGSSWWIASKHHRDYSMWFTSHNSYTEANVKKVAGSKEECKRD